MQESDEIVQSAMKFREDEYYSDEDDYKEDESILKATKGILSISLTEINDFYLKDVAEKIGDLLVIDDILNKVGHKLSSFELIGTPLENFNYWSRLVGLLDAAGRTSIYFFNLSSRFQMLSKYKVIGLLKSLLSKFAPSAFSHSGARAQAEDALNSFGLSPTHVPYYFVEEFFQMTLNIRSATNTPSVESLTAAEEIYKICQGDSDSTILPKFQAANMKSDKRSCEIFRTCASQIVLSDCFPEGIKFAHQFPVLTINRSTYCADLCQYCNLNDSPQGISVIYEYKCDSDSSNGPLLQAYCYGLSILETQQTSKVLLFVITGTVFTVHIQFWSRGVCYLSELQPSTPLNDNNYVTFANWLHAGVAHSQNTDLQSIIPSHPFILPELSSKPYLMLRNLYYESHRNRMYKVYDVSHGDSTRPNSFGICPNAHLVRKYYPMNDDIEETLSNGFVILSFKPIFANNIHHPKNWNQVYHLVQLVVELHTIDCYIHGDLRPPNILFPDDSDECFLIDFDYSRPITGEYYYPVNYGTKNLEILRHNQVKPGGLMKINHDKFALKECLRYYVLNCPGIIPPEIGILLATKSHGQKIITAILESYKATSK